MSKDPEIIEQPEQPATTPDQEVGRRRGRPTIPPSAAESLLAITSVETELSARPDMDEVLAHVNAASISANLIENADKATISTVESLCAAVNLLVKMQLEGDRKAQEMIERGTSATLAITALKVKAYKDRLTNIGNQASLIEFGPKLFKKARESGKPISCLMLDIDYFKSVNDTYGHSVGDQVLTQLAERLTRALRTSDFFMHISEDETQGELFDMATRAGGEEFCALLAGTPLDGACVAAERVRDAIESKPFVVTKTDGSQIKLNISVSIGVAEADFGRVQSVEQLREESDNALYMAKREGRNAVTKTQMTSDGTQTFKTITPKDRYRPQPQKNP